MDRINFAIDCFFETENTLRNLEVKNVDIIFRNKDPLCVKDFIKQFVGLPENETKPENVFPKMNMQHLLKLTEWICKGYFSLERQVETDFKQIVIYLNTLILEYIRIKLLKENEEGFTKTSLSILMHQLSLLNSLKIFDERLEFAFKYLLHSFKVQMVNQGSKEIKSILEKYESSIRFKTDGEASCKDALAAHFTDVMKNFVKSLREFKEFKGTLYILVEFYRRMYYCFLNSIQNIITNSGQNLSPGHLIDLFNLTINLKRSCDRVINDETSLTSTLTDSSLKTLIAFRPLVNRFNTFLQSKIINAFDKEIDSRLKDVAIREFEFSRIFADRLKDSGALLEDLPGLISAKLLKYILFKAISWLFISLSKVKEKMDVLELNAMAEEKIRFIDENMPDHTFANYTKFFEYYMSFVKSRNKAKCEAILGMMLGIIGERLSQEAVQAIIRSKTYSFINFTNIDLENNINKLYEIQKAGEQNMQIRAAAKSKTSSIIHFVRNLVLFRSKLLRLGTATQAQTKVTTAVQETAVEKELKLKLIKKHSIFASFVAFKLKDFERFSPVVLSQIHANYFNKNIKEYSFNIVYSSLKIFLQKKNKRTMRVLFACKLENMQIVDINGAKILSFDYNRTEKILIYHATKEVLLTIYNAFDSIISMFHKFCLNCQAYAD